MSQLLVSKKMILILSLSLISLVDHSWRMSSKSVWASQTSPKLVAQSSRTSWPRISFKLPSKKPPINFQAAAVRGNFPVAILPKTNLGLTVSNSPVIFVYVPENSSDSPRVGQLSIDNKDDQELYSRTLPLTQDRGILMLKLPEKINLSVGESYKWKFSLVDKNGNNQNKFAAGWIQKVPLDNNLVKANSEKEETWAAINIFAEEGIWQDTLEKLALLHLNNPEDQQIQREWTELLKSVGLKEYVAKSKILPYLIEVQ